MGQKNLGLLDFTNQYNVIRTSQNTSLWFGTNNIKRAVLDSNGRFGIGTTLPVDMFEVAGNISLNTAGNKVKIATGSNASIGTATLTAGTVTINTTAVSASSLIFVVYDTPGGTLAAGLSAPVGSIVAGTSFVINSLTTAGLVNVADVSTVRYWIIN